MKDNELIISESVEKVIVIAGIFAMIVFMLLNPAHKTFTYDELDWTLKFVDSGSYGGMIHGLLNWGYNLPLYYSILFLIFQTGTYKEIFYMLPSILFVAVGVYGMYCLGKRNLGRIGGLILFFITVTSGILVSQGGWKVRPYGMMFCFSVWTLHYFLLKLEENTDRNLIFFGAVLLILIYTHWFGSLIAAFYGMADILFIFRKKLSWKNLIPYVIDACLFIPWLVVMFLTHTNTLSDYWANIPDLSSFVSVISYLFNRNRLMVVLFIVFSCFTLVDFIIRREALSGILFGAVIWVMVTVFIYSRYVNPDGSLFVKRYFFVIVPHIYMIFARGALTAADLIKNPLLKKVFYIVLSLLFISNLILSYNKAMESTVEDENQFRQTADYLISKGKLQGDDPLILTSTGREWVNIYLIPETDSIPENMARGTSLDSLVYYMKDGDVSDDEALSRKDLSAYDVIYAFELHSKFKDDIKEFLDKDYECTGEDNSCNLKIFSRNKATK